MYSNIRLPEFERGGSQPHHDLIASSTMSSTRTFVLTFSNTTQCSGILRVAFSFIVSSAYCLGAVAVFGIKEQRRRHVNVMDALRLITKISFWKFTRHATPQLHIWWIVWNDSVFVGQALHIHCSRFHQSLCAVSGDENAAQRKPSSSVVNLTFFA